MKYTVSAGVTISISTTVEADTEESAIEIAEMAGMQTFCYQCSRDAEDEWRTSGELDGDPFDLKVESEAE